MRPDVKRLGHATAQWLLGCFFAAGCVGHGKEQRQRTATSPPAPLPFGPLYDPIPATAVSFDSSDTALAAMLAHASVMAASNVRVFRQLSGGRNFTVMEEGAQFHGAWLETQPMAGAMYAARNARVGLNNQLVFMRAQRADGYLPGQVDPVRAPRPAYNARASSAVGVEMQSGVIQGLFFASPAADMVWYLSLAPGNQAGAYADELARSLERYDQWLWATRNTSAMCRPDSVGCVQPVPEIGPTPPTACCRGETAGVPNRGLLWSDGHSDSGEDHTTRFCKVANQSVPYAPCVVPYSFPIQSGDLTAYSYQCRATLARLAQARGDRIAEQKWSAAAAAVAAALKAGLWDPAAAAMFARDAEDEVVTTMVHDSLRVMWAGAFDQQMADLFVTRHLMNRSEFWTPTPLPSISVSDPRYSAIKNANTWAGRPMGLTFQRSIRALERYGHHVESVMVGERLTEAILAFDGCAGNASRCHFTLEIDPHSSKPIWAPWAPHDGYGPMLMAFAEHTALRVGVAPRPPDMAMGPLRSVATLLWSAVQNSSAATEHKWSYTQQLGPELYTLAVAGGEMVADKNSTELFRSTDGVRVVTDLAGAVTGLVGIRPVPTLVALSVPKAKLGASTISAAVDLTHNTLNFTIGPNEEWAVTRSSDGGLSAKLVRRVPFVPPFLV